MTHQITDELTDIVKKEIGKDIQHLRALADDWLERPESGGTQKIVETLAGIHGSLMIMQQTQTAKISERLSQTFQKLSTMPVEQREEKLEIGAGMIAMALLILSDAIDEIGQHDDAMSANIEQAIHLLNMAEGRESQEEQQTSIGQVIVMPHTWAIIAEYYISQLNESIVLIDRAGVGGVGQLRKNTQKLRQIGDVLILLNMPKVSQQLSGALDHIDHIHDEGGLISFAEELLAVRNALIQLGMYGPKNKRTASQTAKSIMYAANREAMTNMGRQGVHVFTNLRRDLIEKGELEQEKAKRCAVSALEGEALSLLLGTKKQANVLRLMAGYCLRLMKLDNVSEETRNEAADLLVAGEFLFQDMQHAQIETSNAAFLDKALNRVIPPIDLLAMKDELDALVDDNIDDVVLDSFEELQDDTAIDDSALRNPEEVSVEQQGTQNNTASEPVDSEHPNNTPKSVFSMIEHGSMDELRKLSVPESKQSFYDAELSAEVDEEISEIFREEFSELVVQLRQFYQQWLEGQKKVMADVRRVFHTLKGSGRMAQHESLGEFAWRIETMLNHVLDQEIAADEDVIGCVSHAVRLVGLASDNNALEELRAAMLQMAELAEHCLNYKLTGIEPPSLSMTGEDAHIADDSNGLTTKSDAKSEIKASEESVSGQKNESTSTAEIDNLESIPSRLEDDVAFFDEEQLDSEAGENNTAIQQNITQNITQVVGNSDELPNIETQEKLDIQSDIVLPEKENTVEQFTSVPKFDADKEDFSDVHYVGDSLAKHSTNEERGDYQSLDSDIEQHIDKKDNISSVAGISNDIVDNDESEDFLDLALDDGRDLVHADADGDAADLANKQVSTSTRGSSTTDEESEDFLDLALDDGRGLVHADADGDAANLANKQVSTSTRGSSTTDEESEDFLDLALDDGRDLIHADADAANLANKQVNASTQSNNLIDERARKFVDPALNAEGNSTVSNVVSKSEGRSLHNDVPPVAENNAAISEEIFDADVELDDIDFSIEDAQARRAAIKHPIPDGSIDISSDISGTDIPLDGEDDFFDFDESELSSSDGLAASKHISSTSAQHKPVQDTTDDISIDDERFFDFEDVSDDEFTLDSVSQSANTISNVNKGDNSTLRRMDNRLPNSAELDDEQFVNFAEMEEISASSIQSLSDGEQSQKKEAQLTSSLLSVLNKLSEDDVTTTLAEGGLTAALSRIMSKQPDLSGVDIQAVQEELAEKMPNWNATAQQTMANAVHNAYAQLATAHIRPVGPSRIQDFSSHGWHSIVNAIGAVSRRSTIDKADLEAFATMMQSHFEAPLEFSTSEERQHIKEQFVSALVDNTAISKRNADKIAIELLSRFPVEQDEYQAHEAIHNDEAFEQLLTDIADEIEQKHTPSGDTVSRFVGTLKADISESSADGEQVSLDDESLLGLRQAMHEALLTKNETLSENDLSTFLDEVFTRLNHKKEKNIQPSLNENITPQERGETDIVVPESGVVKGSVESLLEDDKDKDDLADDTNAIPVSILPTDRQKEPDKNVIDIPVAVEMVNDKELDEDTDNYREEDSIAFGKIDSVEHSDTNSQGISLRGFSIESEAALREELGDFTHTPIVRTEKIIQNIVGEHELVSINNETEENNQQDIPISQKIDSKTIIQNIVHSASSVDIDSDNIDKAETVVSLKAIDKIEKLNDSGSEDALIVPAAVSAKKVDVADDIETVSEEAEHNASINVDEIPQVAVPKLEDSLGQKQTQESIESSATFKILTDELVKEIAEGHYVEMTDWPIAEIDRRDADDHSNIDSESVAFFMYDLEDRIKRIDDTMSTWQIEHDAANALLDTLNQLSFAAGRVGFNALSECSRQQEGLISAGIEHDEQNERIHLSIQAMQVIVHAAIEEYVLTPYQGILLALANYAKALAATVLSEKLLAAKSYGSANIHHEQELSATDRLFAELQSMSKQSDENKQFYHQPQTQKAIEDTFLRAVDDFETLAQHQDIREKPASIIQLLEALYDIEESLASQDVPAWIWNLLDAVEQLLNEFQRDGIALSSECIVLLQESVELIEQFKQDEGDVHAIADCERQASRVIDQLMQLRQKHIAERPQQLVISPQLESTAVSSAPSQQGQLDPNAGNHLVDVFCDEAQEVLAIARSNQQEWSADYRKISAIADLVKNLHTLHSSASVLEYHAIMEMAETLERLAGIICDGICTNTVDAGKLLAKGLADLNSMLIRVREGQLPFASSLREQIEQFIYTQLANADEVQLVVQKHEVEQLSPNTTEQATSIQANMSVDSIAESNVSEEIEWDDDLLEIFTDEAQELLSTAKEQLNCNIAESNVQNQIQRVMHTLKGGARMVGLPMIGYTAHLIESVVEKIPAMSVEQIEQADKLLHRGYDAHVEMLDSVIRHELPIAPKELDTDLNSFIDELNGVHKAVHSIDTPDSSQDVQNTVIHATDSVSVEKHIGQQSDEIKENISSVNASDVNDKLQQLQPELSKKTHIEQHTAKTSGKQIRVSEDMLESLTTMVGEAGILRVAMDNIAQNTEYNLGELDRIAQRIDEQLRRFDSQAEAQILFRRENSIMVGEFDPLEMDRFSEMQQLSRQLAEAIDDLKSTQQTIANEISQFRSLGVQQGAIHHEVQERLMSAQLLRFDTYEGRLRRLVNQVAASIGKNVRLEIIGGNVEVERRLLDDLLAPLEHIIRNAIAHGIETPEERKAVGKAVQGVVKIDVRSMPNELIARVIDDGRGLDYDKIRESARKKGWLDESRANDEEYLNSLLMRAGMTTSQKVSQLSGRGVGLDVVNDMLKRRRGQMSIRTISGYGTEFCLKVPSGLSIVDILMVASAGEIFAVPMGSITSVMQLDAKQVELARSGEDVAFTYRGRDYPVVSLGRYLTSDYELPKGQNTLPGLVIDLPNGDSGRVFQIDRVVNRLEVVIKDIHHQASVVTGIMGATVMADGRVLPVMDMVSLIHRIENMRPVELVTEEDERQTRILIVDDSVTMRKVGMRLLTRNGYEVGVAKDGLDALEILPLFEPDLILLDIEMPRMDGFEFAHQLRAQERFADTPVVMITSRTGDKHRAKAAEAGVNNYLGKPYKEEELLSVIHQLLDK